MNKELIEQFETLYEYYKKNKDKGRIIAYSKAIASLRDIDKEIRDISDVSNIRNIGPKVKAKIKEYLDTGTIQAVEERRKEMANLSEKDKILLNLEKVWGIGPSKAVILYDQGIRSIEDLKERLDLLTANQRIGLKYYDDLQKKVPRNTITALLVIFKYFLNNKFGKDTYNIEIAGSYRRGAKQSGDIDCLLSSPKFDLKQAVQVLIDNNIITDILGLRNTKFMGIVHCPGGNQYIRLDIEYVDKKEWGSALLYFTGSKAFNVKIRGEARRKGMLLNEHGLFNATNGEKIIDDASEKEILKEIGFDYVQPEKR